MSLHMSVSELNAIPSSYRTVIVTTEPKPGTDFMAKSFTVTLLGVSKTRIITSDGEVHESSATFLKIQKEVYYGPTLLEDGSPTYFFFQFPDDPVLRQHHPIDVNWYTNRDRPKPHALPPSGDYGPGNSIDYSFEAILVDGFTNSEIKATTKIEFSPTREAEVSDPQIFTTFSKNILANPDRYMNPSSLRLALDSPQVLIQDQDFPLRLRLLHKTARSVYSVHSVPPTVLLRCCLVQLLENTFIQSEKSTRDQWTKKHTIASHGTSIHPKAGAPEITTQGLDMGSLLQSPRIPSNLASSFECVNIQRTYSLKVSLVVECGGETYDIAFDLSPVTLLGAELGDVGRNREEEEGYDPEIDGVRTWVDGCLCIE